MPSKIRWGIVGTGRIAGLFAEGLAEIPDAELVAVGSRTQAAANAFAKKHKVRHAHASYQKLVDDDSVDVVYVATPHNLHMENSIMALDAGKAVLNEKPFAINAREARKIIKKARAKKLLLMEAMWMRFLPPIVKLRELLAKKVIGEVRMVDADFGFRKEERVGRLFERELGGGALLDVGIYPLSLTSMILGKPSKVVGIANIGPTGVDEHSAAVLGHPGGQIAVMHTAVRTDTFHEASIIGDKGRIRLHSGYWMGSDLTVFRGGGLLKGEGGGKRIKVPFKGNGYQFQAIEFMKCLRQGKLECPIMPLDESLSLMETMDTLRAQWGLKYPME